MRRALVWLAVLCGAALAPATASAASAVTVTVSTDEPVWVLGTAKRFTATLRNDSETAWTFDRFGDANAVYEGKRPPAIVPSCWVFARLDGIALVTLRAPRYTLAREQFVRLARGEAMTQTLSLTWPDATPGPIELRLVYSPRASSPSFSFPDHWIGQQGLDESMWLGLVTSNPLTLEVVSP